MKHKTKKLYTWTVRENGTGSSPLCCLPTEGTPFSSEGRPPHSHPWQLLEVVQNNLHGHWTSLVLAHYSCVPGCFLSDYESPGFHFLFVLWSTLSPLKDLFFHALLFCVMNWFIRTPDIRKGILQRFDQMPFPKEYLWITGKHISSSEKGKLKWA